MKGFYILNFICLFLVSNVCGDISLQNKFITTRLKRQIDEDRWTWGYVDATTKRDESETTDSTISNKEFNPCEDHVYHQPKFKAPSSKRISEQKCLEYLWDVEFRINQTILIQKCNEYKNTHPEYNGPNYAIGGRTALPGEYPHMGALGWKATQGTWIFKCGGSLISPKFVLTAAHCTRASDRDTTITDSVPKIVRLGDKNIIDVYANGLDPRDVNISRIIVHPNYNSPKKYNDIALVELEYEQYFTQNVQPACLWNYFDTSTLGKEAAVTGWGVIETTGRTTSPDLQVSVVDVIDSSTCDNLLRPHCNRHWCGVQDSQICAGKLAGGVDACQGDSGGPLQMKINLPTNEQGAMHYVIGVTSFGFGCAQKNTPGIYTRVSAYIDWIENIVWQ